MDRARDGYQSLTVVKLTNVLWLSSFNWLRVTTNWAAVRASLGYRQATTADKHCILVSAAVRPVVPWFPGRRVGEARGM